MLNSVALRAGVRSLRTFSTNQAQNPPFRNPSTSVTFSAQRNASSNASQSIASSSVSSNASLFERISSFGSLKERAFIEALHQPAPIKTNWLDKRNVKLFLDKQKLTISRKVLRLINQEEQEVEKDFKKLHQYFDYLPGSQAQGYTELAHDRFHNGFSETLRKWVRRDLSAFKPKDFTSATSMRAGLQSYGNNLEAIDEFLGHALDSASAFQGARRHLTDHQRKCVETATQNLEKTERDVHDYRDALNHLVLKPGFMTEA